MTAHPAKFTSAIVELFRDVAERHLRRGAYILDPFAGVGTIHALRPRWETWGVELEPEWAHHSPWTVVGDSRDLVSVCNSIFKFDAVMTSPCYGNRMADHHDAKDASRRHTYRHTLGRALTDGNTGAMQWGEAYRQVHRDVYASCVKVLRPGALFVLNMSDHIRKGEVVPVTDWHAGALAGLGFVLLEEHHIATPRQRHGANGRARVDHEDVLVFELGAPATRYSTSESETP